MDVLIVERDELMGTMLADTLDAEGISATVATDEEALNLPSEEEPQVIITGINRGHYEDLRGLEVVSAIRRKWPQLCAILLSAVWPVRLRRDRLALNERYLSKPVSLTQLSRTVRELLDSGACGRTASPPVIPGHER